MRVEIPAEPSYEDLAREALELVRKANALLEDKYQMGTWERWNLDQTSGHLRFSNAGRDRLVFISCIVGSLSTKSDTWLWSWANKSIQENMSTPVLPAKEHGEKHAFERLTVAKWSAEETDGWEVSAIVCKLVGGLGVYRGPAANGFTFIIPLTLVYYDP